MILVDDGLATGATMQAAVLALRQHAPARIVVAVPVGARETCDRLRRFADQVVCVATPEPFNAVGLWYDEFSQTTDDEVRRLRVSAHGQNSGPPGWPKSDVLDVVRGRRATWRRPGQYDTLLEAIGDARFVLLGEATHGTHEFYRERARITRRLIEEKGFTRSRSRPTGPTPTASTATCAATSRRRRRRAGARRLRRFPTWMWRNADVLDFVELAAGAQRRAQPADKRAGFYGLDLYSLHARCRPCSATSSRSTPRRPGGRASATPASTSSARTRRPTATAGFGLHPSCEEEVVTQLVELHARRPRYARRDGRVAADEFFDAEQNARLVKNAEEYYRTMFRGRCRRGTCATATWPRRSRRCVAHLERTRRGAQGRRLGAQLAPRRRARDGDGRSAAS